MGCVNPSQIAVWEDYDGNQFFNCPLQFISDEAIRWYENFKYDSVFSGAVVNYKNQSAKYIAAVAYFNAAVHSYLARSPQNSKRTSDSLSQLRISFQRRNNA